MCPQLRVLQYIPDVVGMKRHEDTALSEGLCKSERLCGGKPQQISYILLFIRFPVNSQAVIAVGIGGQGTVSCLRTFLQRGHQVVGAPSHTADLISLVLPLTSAFC